MLIEFLPAHDAPVTEGDLLTSLFEVSRIGDVRKADATNCVTDASMTGLAGGVTSDLLLRTPGFGFGSFFPPSLPLLGGHLFGGIQGRAD